VGTEVFNAKVTVN